MVDVFSAYTVVKLRKLSNGVETELGSGQSNIISVNQASTTYSRSPTHNIKFSIPETLFAVGDKIRVTIEVWGKATGSSGNAYLGHDPKNRTTTILNATDSTQLIAILPVKVDL